MMKSLFVCLIVSSGCVADSPPVTKETGSQGWIEQRCVAYRGDWCRIPFAVALAHASELAAPKIKIQLRGYLIREEERYVLYPDRESAQRMIQSEAFVLEVPPDSPQLEKSLELSDRTNVEVRGRVVLHASDRTEYWANFQVDLPVRSMPVRREILKE
jgi:hypothetical protein